IGREILVHDVRVVDRDDGLLATEYGLRVGRRECAARAEEEHRYCDRHRVVIGEKLPQFVHTVRQKYTTGDLTPRLPLEAIPAHPDIPVANGARSQAPRARPPYRHPEAR